GARAADQRVGLAAEGQGGQVRRLDLGRIVHAGGHALAEQLDQELFLAGRRVLQQFDQVGGLLRVQRQRRNAEGGAFGGVLAVGFQHGGSPGKSEKRRTKQGAAGKDGPARYGRVRPWAR